MLTITDQDRVRLLTLDRPDALNAFNEALYDAVSEALIEAAGDDAVATVVITGSGRAFSAGQDLLEMSERITNPDFVQGTHGFPGLIDQLAAFPKPLLLAINGLGLGIGTTIIGFADLVFMSTDARLKCPFTSLGVAPEAASSLLLPQLLGYRRAAEALLLGEPFSAEAALEMGLVNKVLPPGEANAYAQQIAARLAAKPRSSLTVTKRLMKQDQEAAVLARMREEGGHFLRMLQEGAAREAFTAFMQKRKPDFSAF